jgi:glycosyltransferase involved in cell wall biosynthesis
MLPALRSGGVEQGTVEVTAALVRAGHRALVMSAGGPMVRAVEQAGGEHTAWPVADKSPFALRLVPRLRRFLARECVDIVHPRSRLPAWIAWLAWRSMQAAQRPRLITTVHGFYRVGRYSGVMLRGERVICVSAAIRDHVRTHYPQVPEQRLVVIPRGIDHARYPHGYVPPSAWLRRWQAAMPQLAQRRVLLLPARVTRLKGHADFIALLAGLLEQGMDVHGLVAGGEDPRHAGYARELRARVRALALEERVSFLGHRSDLREVMAVSDLVLSLSATPESFGRSVLEALSLGRPTVGYAHGGVAELLDTLYPQGAVAPGDAGQLAQCARSALLDPSPVREVRAFKLSDMLASTLAQYQALAGTRTR